jgi:hypothetical protein
MLAAYYDTKQVALHRISYQKKDMIVNPIHYQRLSIKQSFDVENTLLIGDEVLDRPIIPHDLSVYDEVAS